MEFTLEDRQTNSIISYDGKQVYLSSQSIKTPCFISKTQLIKLETITVSSLDKALIFPLIQEDKINILIIGTGKVASFLPAKIHSQLQQLGLGVEVMPNQSACRCYNLLLSDYRQVGLLLF